jgi:rhodanese-related sulfurtransferase
LNPHNKAPKFTLRDDRYVSAEQLLKALKDGSRMVMLDARSKAAWRQTHIPGAVSVPYYEEPEKFIKDIPNDSTWIVVYCACPHAASDKVVTTLRRFGYKHTAILDEGILVWAQRGYPVQNGQDLTAKK